MPPMHARLLVASGDKYPRCRLSVGGGDVVAVFPEPPVTHVVAAPVEVPERGGSLLRLLKFPCIQPSDPVDRRLRPVSVRDASARCVLRVRVPDAEREAACVEVGAGVHDIVCEHRIREGVGECLPERVLPVGHALHAGGACQSRVRCRGAGEAP